MSEFKPAEGPQTPQVLDVPEDPETPEEEVVENKGSYHYCLEENHPGAPSFQTAPLSLVRIFQSDKDVPECPACGRQVNSMPCEGPDIPPESILELQERFGR